MTTIVPPRSEIAREHTWDTESVYSSEGVWADGMRELSERLKGITAYQGRLGDGPAVLAEWLEQYQALVRQVGRLYVYAGMHQSVDTADQAAQAKVDQMLGLYGRTLAAMA
ncbi:MAG: oligoendopeptidase F, partial [Ardenticatenaceae bacterium]